MLQYIGHYQDLYNLEHAKKEHAYHPESAPRTSSKLIISHSYASLERKMQLYNTKEYKITYRNKDFAFKWLTFKFPAIGPLR
jgi:hypothetical protein